MPGRHASHVAVSRPRWPRRLFALIVVLGAAAGASYVGRDYLPEPVRDIAERFLADDGGCAGTVSVDITASPDIAPALAAILEEGSGELPQIDGACIETAITPLASAEMAATIGPQSSVDLWVPDSSMWLDRMSAEGIELGEVTSIASSPLVAVASEPMANQIGWPDTEFSWTAVLSSDGPPATIVDPTSSSTGFATLLAAGVALGVGTDAADQLAVVGAMTALSQNVTPTVEEAFAAADQAPDEAPVFTAIEQAVARHNQASFNPVVALYPAEGTVLFDYPAIPVGRPDTPLAVREAAGELVAYFSSQEAVQVLHQHGFRSADGTAGANVGIGDNLDPGPVQALPALPPEVSRELVSQWTALSLDMRMLAVIDVSGSMIETDGTDQSRAELVQGAATTALALLPDSSSVGLWVFSTLENTETEADWRELVPIGPLSEPVETEQGEVSRLEALGGAAAQIPGIVEANAPHATRGWTGLYDTINGAFNAIKDGYEASKINSIVVLTDGADESPPGLSSDVSLDELLAMIESQDPTRPIPIIVIGIGEEADMDALTEIADASGGSAHQALDPADVQEVFIQAMIDRQCRPMCG